MMTKEEIDYEREMLLSILPLLNAEGQAEYKKRLQELNEVCVEPTILA